VPKDNKKKDSWYESVKKTQFDSEIDVKAAKATAQAAGEKLAKESPGGTTRLPSGAETGPEIIQIPGALSGTELRSGSHTVSQVATRTPEEEERLQKGMDDMEESRKPVPAPKTEEPGKGTEAVHSY
jgi:hypothetical protein